MPSIRLDESFLTPSKLGKRTEGGVFSFIVRNSVVDASLSELYGRQGLCLKIFKHSLEGELEDYVWGKTVTLGESVRAQNLLAMHGLAPRVYGLVEVNGKAAQVTDYVVDDGHGLDRKAMRRVMKRYGVRAVSHDMNEHNWVGGKLVDCQYLRVDKEIHEKWLTEQVHGSPAWGSRSEPYQAIPEMGIAGQRDQESRAKLMRLDEEKRGTVLDVGCNLGAMGRWRGWKRYVGFDQAAVAEIAAVLNNWLGHWNLDFVSERPEERFDVVLCLSCKQAKPVPWVFELCRETMYWEGHVPDKEDTYRPLLEQHFQQVEFLGATRDHGPRPLFRCRK